MSSRPKPVPEVTRPQDSSVTEAGLRLQCPLCDHPLATFDPASTLTSPRCSSCGFTLFNSNGIWHALAPARKEHFRQFIHEYQTVRSSEGRCSPGAHFYLALPYQDLTGRNAWQWKIRARSFDFLEQRILPQIQREYPRGFDFLDIGAGNGWMSYRLALRGHRPVAVDLLVNDEDGLGAARHYFYYLPKPFPRFQAEMDHLPFGPQQFDVVIFNASFHYSENYQRTLREASRCLRRPGHILIVDSPFYNRDDSGQRMVEQRRGDFQKRFGFRSDSVASREYLTPQVLEDLARSCSLTWRILTPWYGLSWALRPFKSWLWRRRESAKFYILWAVVKNS